MSIYNADRSAQSFVMVNLISPTTPLLINENSNMPQGSMNGGDKLLLSGIVTLPFGATGTCGWSVDDDSFNLQSSSPSPLSLTLRSSGLNPINVYMALAANSVPTGASLTFSLTCEVPSSPSRATASINIVVNSPPQPGNFYVKPNTGVELSQKFTFIAENWQSVNLPISYQFGYVSSTNLNIVLRSNCLFITLLNLTMLNLTMLNMTSFYIAMHLSHHETDTNKTINCNQHQSMTTCQHPSTCDETQIMAQL
jgi:hypothetical protein